MAFKIFPRARIFLLLFFGFALFYAFPAFSAAPLWLPQAMLDPRSQTTPLLPFLDYYVDESVSLDIEEAAAPAHASAYKPLILDSLPRSEGAIWLRFTLAPIGAGEKPGAFLLDMGQSVPGIAVLYDPEPNKLSGSLEWRESMPAQRNIFLLPECGAEPITCYLRLEGFPGPWFYPVIRSAQNAASNWLSLARPAAILALGVIMFLCLMRGISESGQWRVWTALFVCAALVQAILGMPVSGAGANLKNLAAVLSPGIALMLLPHVGRHLLRAHDRSRLIDLQLLLLSLPGAVLALLPLAHGWEWLDRWLDIWPICTLLFVPTALGAWIGGLGGARRFLLACLVAPVFVALSLVGLNFSVSPALLSSLPVWGVGLCALLLATTASPADMRDTVQPAAADNDAAPVINLEHPLDDPALRISPSTPFTVVTEVPPDKKDQPCGLAPQTEYALHEASETLLREAEKLEKGSHDPALKTALAKIAAQAGLIESILGNGQSGDKTKDEEKDVPVRFNLQHILREAHDAVSQEAEKNNVSISWHMPPHLGQLYRGPGPALRSALQGLLESSIRASSHGAVRLAARRAPDSADAGYLLFTVTDNGSGLPPEKRSTFALAKAWDLAGHNGGYLGLESGAEGAVISFSLRLAPLEEDNEEPAERRPHVLLACDDPRLKRTLAALLGQLSTRVTQTATAHEALVSQSLDPAMLLIAGGRLAMPSADNLARNFISLARQAGFTNCYALAITEDDSQWQLLKPNGFTHAMLDPVEPDAFKKAVADLTHAPLLKNAPQNQPAEPDLNLQEETVDKTAAEDIAAYNEWPGLAQSDAHVKNNEKSAQAREEEDIPLTMLVDQDLPLPNSFEGPGWLGVESERQEDLDIEIEQPGNPVHRDQAKAGTTSGLELPNDSAPAPAASAPDSGQAPAESHEEMSAALAESKAPLTDFIVGVERADEQPAESEAEKQAPGSPDQDKKDFAQASVNLAASTLSHALPSEKPTELPEDVDPVIAALAADLEISIAEARTAFSQQDFSIISASTGHIAEEAENHGLRVLGRMARCVRQASEAGDLAALNDLLPELGLAVERNIITLIPRKKSPQKSR